MKKEILDRLQKLGANVEHVKGVSLLEDLQSITFDQPLYPHELWGTELYGIDEFFERNKSLYQQDKGKFYKNLNSHFFSLAQNPYGQMFYSGQLFTPFRENSDDYQEWNQIFTDEDEVDLYEVYQITDNQQPDFIILLNSNGYPDNYYICLSDHNPENPTVFGTDHEEFFSEISNEGTLLEFLEQFYTQSEFLEIVTNYIENEKTNK